MLPVPKIPCSTYQGRVLDNGTNFTGTGQFEFALVTSTNANQTATATAGAPSGGFITVITRHLGRQRLYQRAGRDHLWRRRFERGGHRHGLLDCSVTAININPGGNGAGYTNTPTVTIAPPPPVLSYTSYWSNDGTSSAGSEPEASVGVTVANGLFNVVLGDTTIPNMAAISAALFEPTGIAIADLVQRRHARVFLP